MPTAGRRIRGRTYSAAITDFPIVHCAKEDGDSQRCRCGRLGDKYAIAAFP